MFLDHRNRYVVLHNSTTKHDVIGQTCCGRPEMGGVNKPMLKRKRSVT